ncbi:hypothetical protein [Mameliella alba]|uniref:hypothetical protein n=2 Tax=Mameliella alba TaxID=561184 RepID=UPI0036D2178D
MFAETSGSERMGEAKRKARELQQWLNALTVEERVVYSAARALYDRFIRPERVTEMCYHSVFFLHEYIKNSHGIIVEPTIGYINDGTDEVFMSHAWLDFKDKKTDVSLTFTSRPEINPPGQLIYHDRVFGQGHVYSYHREITQAGRAALEEIRISGGFDMVDQKEREHARMLILAEDRCQIRAYLDSAPKGMTYEEIVARISD